MAGPTLTGAGWLVDEIDRQLVQYDAETQSLVSGDGTGLPFLTGVNESGLSATVSAMLNARRLSPAVDVTLPTPYSGIGAAVVHPSPEFVMSGWQGYPYWMATTPYPGNDSIYENPCVLASLDGKTWVNPPGVTNPIFAKPTPTLAYNSDPFLLLNPLDSTQMIMLYRARNITGDNRLLISTSRDGWKTFTDAVQIWSGTIAGSNDMASPSIWYNTTTSKWEIVGHNSDTAGFPLRKITSDNLLSGWDTSPSSITFTPASGRAWWHSHFRRDASGLIYGIAQDNSGTVGNPGNLYLAWSEDGATYSYAAVDLGGNWYKAGFVPRANAEGRLFFDCYFSKLLNTTTQRVTISFDADEYQDLKNIGNAMLVQSLQGVPGPLWADVFTRVDSAVAIGTSTSGGTYTTDSGTMGISTNRAYGVSTGSNNRTLSAAIGSVNHTMPVKVDTVGTQGWAIFRAVDSANYWRLGWNTASTYRVQSIVAGAVGAVDLVVGAAPTAGDVIRAVAFGNQIKLYINDVLVFEVASSVHITGQKVGIQSTGASLTYWDNLCAWRS